MAKYEVRIDETLTHTVVLDAASPQKAKELAYEIVMNGQDSQYATESLGTQVITAIVVSEANLKTEVRNEDMQKGA